MRLVVAAMLSWIAIFSTSVASAEYAVDIADCSAPAEQFEMVLCANHGAFDLLNHIHQMLTDPPDPVVAAPHIQAFGAWVDSIEARCMGGDVRLASDCIYDLAAGHESQEFLAAIEVLYAGESDIEGDEECDGCENEELADATEPAAAEQPASQAAIDPAAPAGDREPATIEALEGMYVAYQTALPCRDLGLVRPQDVELIERIAKEFEKGFGQADLDGAWARAQQTTQLTNQVFGMGSDEHIRNACDYVAMTAAAAAMALPAEGQPKPF